VGLDFAEFQQCFERNGTVDVGVLGEISNFVEGLIVVTATGEEFFKGMG
jgi:hypothetical protein